jgi:PAS domain S-box-containing protein
MSTPLFVIAAAALLLAVGWAASATARGRRLAAQLAALEARQREQQAAIERIDAERTRAEHASRSTEARYQAALQGSQDGLWEWQLDSGRVLLSPRWKGMLGHTAETLADERTAWLGCVHADDRAAFEAALTRRLAGSETRFEHELRLLHRDGSVRHVLSRAVVVRDDAGAPERVLGMDTDVTRLKRVQAVLDAVADGTAGAHGERFFATMAQHFARALGVDCAFIAECADQPTTKVRTLAYWSAEQGFRDNFEFALAGTPCAEVIAGGRTCFYPEGLAERFPREAGWEAYLGMPIVGSDGRVLGHLAMFDRSPLGDDMLIERVYRIFLARAAAEIERIQALTRLALLQPAGASS